MRICVIRIAELRRMLYAISMPTNSRFFNRPPLVAIRFNMSVKNSRETLRGILRYVGERGHWSIRLFDSPEGLPALPSLEARGFNGFIGHVGSTAVFNRMAQFQIPVITVDEPPLAGVIQCDNATIAKAAADMFLARGFRDFAYIGVSRSASWSQIRSRVFSETLDQAGFKVNVYRPLNRNNNLSDATEQRRLASWISGLPAGTALFVANDQRALQVIDVCHEVQKSIPQDIAILSCDNDEILCETSSPSLSSIQMTTEEAGYEAAHTLDLLMRGQESRDPIVIPYRFRNIVERSSTSNFSTHSDPLVAKAITFLRLNHASHFTIQDLVKELHASRRTIETRFHAATGKTLHQALEQIRIDTACTALKTSDMTIEEIALACGYASASHFDHAFKKVLGHSPKSFRRRI